MSKIFLLLKAEVTRLIKYKIIVFGLIVTLIWLILLSVVNEEEAKTLLPQLLVFDTGLMTIILLASSYFFEKQEGTLKALFVTPVNLIQILTAKLISTLVSAIVSIILMSLVMVIFHNYWLPLPLALLIVIVSTTTHVAIGYPLIFMSKDFMDLLVKYTFLALFFLLPSILVSLDVIPLDALWVAFLSPMYATQYLLSGLITPIDTFLGVIAVFMLFVPSFILFPTVVYPYFKKEVMHG
jgi:fluoroquinolone transport system permease protein